MVDLDFLLISWISNWSESEFSSWFSLPIISLHSLGPQILTRNDEGIKDRLIDTETEKLASDGHACSGGEASALQKHAYYMQLNKGAGLAKLGGSGLCRGAVFRPPTGRKLCWAISIHTVHICTWIRKKGFAISLSIDSGRSWDFLWV